MEIALEFFKSLTENYGVVFTTLFIILGLVFFLIYFIIKTFPDTIKKLIEQRLFDEDVKHKSGINKRKSAFVDINKSLSNLIRETNSDRALLFEFSNGKSNLAGLPFLFVNATGESLNAGISSVIHLYQRVNISIFSKFVLELEDKGYFFVDDIEKIKHTYPVIYNLLIVNHVKSALFYSIYGIDETLGFLVVTSVNDKILSRKEALPRVAECAQKISSYLTLKDLN